MLTTTSSKKSANKLRCTCQQSSNKMSINMILEKNCHLASNMDWQAQNKQVLMFYHLKTRLRATWNSVNTSISAFIKACEKGLITKEYIVTDTHLNFIFKWALCFSTLVIKLFNSLQLLPQLYEPAFFWTIRHHSCDTLTLKNKTKALCLASKEEWVKHLMLLYKWLIQPYVSLLWR